jgi:glycogen debranching enzyme
MARVHIVSVASNASEGPKGGTPRQPYLHEAATAVRAPGVALSAADGQLESRAHGAFWADRRLLSRFTVTADGVAAVGVQHAEPAPGVLHFLGVLRELGDPGPDPTVTLTRVRTVVDAGLTERIEVRTSAEAAVTTRLEVALECDYADMASVKSGSAGNPLPAQPTPDGLVWHAPDGAEVRVGCEPAPDTVTGTALGWQLNLQRGEQFAVSVQVRVVGGPAPVVRPAADGARLLVPEGFAVHSGDHRFSALVERSLADLSSLCLTDPLAEADHFLAAGAPWFLTLFGRDAIWAARMVLPLGTDLAAGTLRALARRQGTVTDPDSAQQPGKIMHEIRAAPTTHAGQDLHLPPLYYGTVDATALWISLLCDAWRWGLPEAEVAQLLPAAERAMTWLVDYGIGPDGFVSYRDSTGRGLANQGWKDSGDSVQFRDGRLAEPPIALCEVQGYAYAAARQATELFAAFGRPGAERWPTWADQLAERFRASFWIEDDVGPYPAIALDADGKPVDTATSNIAHLVGTGLLSGEEEAAVVARLRRSDLDSGFGLRTMSTTSAGFNPLGYHAGSVWTHDTAIAVAALTASDARGAPEAAAALSAGLLRAAPSFAFRLPELFGGHDREAVRTPVPYPAACRPQAWAAGASITLLGALLGLRADVPAGRVRLRPLRPSPVGRLEVHNLRYGAGRFTVSVDEAGDPTVTGLPRDVVVTVD